MAPGDYGLSTAINAPSQITIHGVAGQQRPRLQFSTGAWLALNDSTLRYVAVDQTYAPARAVTTAGGKLDQVVIRGGATVDCAVGVTNGTVRNSIVVARSANGSAICSSAWNTTNNSTYRNVTAIAQGGAAIQADAMTASANVLLTVINTIAKAGPTGAASR